jgi:hypothetical protein
MPTPKPIPARRARRLKPGTDLEAHIISGETAEDLAQITAEFSEKFRPADATERFLVETLIHNEWRLRRMRRVEAAVWEQALGKHAALDARSPGQALPTAVAALDRLQRIIDSCQRNYHRALKELISLQQARVKNRHAESKTVGGAAPRNKKTSETIEPFDSSFQTLFKQ